MNAREVGRRFIWGVVRPFQLSWALHQRPEVFRRAIRSALLQAGATVALAAAVIAFRNDEWAFSPQAEAPKNAAVLNVAGVKVTLPGPPPVPPEPTAGATNDLPVPPPQDGAERPADEQTVVDDTDEADAEEPEPPGLSALAQAAAVLAERAEDEAKSPAERAELKKALRNVRDQLRTATKARVKEQRDKRAELAAKSQETARPDPGDGTDEDPTPVDGTPWWRRFVALAFSTLIAAQWVVLALCRDFQDRTSRELALTAGIEPEEADVVPRIRVDFKWLRRKLRRRIRGVLVLVPGFIASAPLLFVGYLTKSSEFVTPLITTAWTFYWWMVFSAARTARAWAWETTAGPNAPLRWWVWLTENVPGFRWWGARAVTWLWVRMTRSMFSPAKAVEFDPAAFAGLSLARLVGNVPIIRVFVRPAMSVVAAEIVARHESALQALPASLEPLTSSEGQSRPVSARATLDWGGRR